MTVVEIEKRSLQGVHEKIWRAVDLMEREFGGRLTHDSGHGKSAANGSPLWIFSFPKYDNAQIGILMNRRKFAMYMRSKAVDGRDLRTLLHELGEVDEIYTNEGGKVHQSLLNKNKASFLNPSARNPLLKILPKGSLLTLLELYLSAETHKTPSSLGDQRDDRSQHPYPKKPVFTEDELRSQLDRKNETGLRGELFVVQDEVERLRSCGCPEPKDFVHRVAAIDVGRGFDVESTWPGEERFIEVKATTRSGSDFFLTLNERNVLSELGDRAWIYRVIVDDSGNSYVESRLQNPIKYIKEDDLLPVVWRVKSLA